MTSEGAFKNNLILYKDINENDALVEEKVSYLNKMGINLFIDDKIKKSSQSAASSKASKKSASAKN